MSEEKDSSFYSSSSSSSTTTTTTTNNNNNTSHCPEPASLATTEIAFNIINMDLSPEERMEILRAAGVKVRDFAYEPIPNSSKALVIHAK